VIFGGFHAWKKQIITYTLVTFTIRIQAIQMTVTLTTRSSEELARKVEELAKKEGVDRSAIIRKLLKEAVARKTLENVLQEYREGKISLWKAASKAGITLWEIVDILAREGIPLDYDRESLREDLEPLRRKKSAGGK